MHTIRTHLGTLLVATALVISVSGAATASGAAVSARRSPRTALSATSTAKVKMIDFAFSPKRITIPKGTRLKWVNVGDTPHTSTSNTGKWDSGTVGPGESFSHVFKRAGTFRYHCEFHASMVGRIIVA